MYTHCGFNSRVSPLQHSKKCPADFDRAKNKEQTNYENNVNNSGNYNAKRKLQRKGDATKSKETTKRKSKFQCKMYYKSIQKKKENNETVEFALETEKYEYKYKIQRSGETHNENEIVKKKWCDNKRKR